MNFKDIDLLFENTGTEVLQAHNEIVDLQKSKTSTLRFGLSHLDFFLIGGLKNNLIFAGARPGQGKTHLSQEMINNLLSKEINPDKDVLILRMNLEMQTRALLLRDLKQSLNKSMRDIVSEPYTEFEQGIVKQVVKRHRDPRVVNWSKAVNGEELRYLLNKLLQKAEFIYQGKLKLAKEAAMIAIKDIGIPEEALALYNELTNIGRDEVIVMVDHIHIYPNKTEIDTFLTICNEYKMMYTHLSFVFFFQLNRSLEQNWRGTSDKPANPKNFRPNSGHIYNTDILYQVADIVLTLVIPQTVGLDEYASVYKEYYEHLEEHFVVGDSLDNKTARLKGRNRVFYEYIKIRMADDMEDPRLYCTVLNPSLEGKIDEQTKRANPINVAPKFSVTKKVVEEPVFEKPYSDVPVNTDMSSAFDPPDEPKAKEGEDMDFNDPPF